MKISSGFAAGFAAAVLLGAAPLRAEDARPIDHITVQQGLSQSSASCLLLDRQGFLWIGTQNGLDRYDGSRFTVFQTDRSDPGSISENYITALFEDRGGGLWVGTQSSGLNLLDRQTGRFTRYRHDPANSRSIASDSICAIREDAAGDLWIGTWGAGLSRIHRSSGTFTNYRHDNNDPTSLSNNNVWCVAADHTGAIWAGTYDGLNRLDPKTGRFVVFRHDPANPATLTQNNVVTLLEDHAGTLWVGTWGGGLARYDRERSEFRAYRHDATDSTTLSEDKVWALAEDAHHQLWVGTAGGGLNRFDGERFTRYLQPESRPEGPEVAPGISSIAIDGAGIVWAGTNGTGLYKLRPPIKPFTRYAHVAGDPLSLSAGNVWAVCEDHAGVVWAAPFGGALNRIDPVTGRVTVHELDSKKGPLHDTIYAIVEDVSGTLWVATNSSGLLRWDESRRCLTSFAASPTERLAGAHLLTLWADADGSLWIGTLDRGLFRLDSRTAAVTTFPVDPKKPGALASNAITCIRRTRDGVLWLGTFGDGLVRYSNGSFTYFRAQADNPHALSDGRVDALYEDPAGALWIGTSGGGLNRLSQDRRTFAVFTQKNGLPDDTVYGILGDEAGSLWLSTNRGICRFSPSSRSVRTYTTSDGLLDSEFNQGAFYRGPSGRMHFGGTNGLTSFVPEDIRDNSHVPPVVITSFARFGESPMDRRDFAPTDVLTLDHNESSFAIEFAALDFTAPEKNQFQYRLEGLDDNWSHPSPRSYVSYAKVPPGRYTFRVRAANSDNIWNTAGTSFDIVVTPPPWATRGAYMIYGAACLVVGLALYTWRARSRRRERAAQRAELERERERAEASIALERERRLSEERFRKFMENFPGIGFIKDTESRVVYVNKAFEQALGILSGEALGKKDEENFRPEEAAQFREVDSRVVQGRLPVECVDVMPSPDGPRYFQTTKFPIFDDEGRVILIGGVAVDITDRKRLELQLLQSQKLESIGTLAGGIAHDFNNLLAIIDGYATLMRSGKIDESGAARCMSAIEQAVQRGSSLVRQILTFARKSDVSFEPLDMNALIREIAGMLRETFPKTIHIALDLHPSLPSINADHAKVHQALLNLSVNSRDAMSHGGTLSFSTAVVEAGKLRGSLSGGDPRGYVCVVVSDTGLGMDEYARRRAFEPFFTTKGPGLGTGLGLAVVYGVLQAHHGQVELESEPGRGTTFRLYWPVGTGPSAAVIEKPPAAARVSRVPATLLVVEDEALLADLLTEVLLQEGYRVVLARDGEEAVKAYRERRSEIDLVLMDYGLPKLPGDKAFEQLKAIDPDVKVVICSGNLDVAVHGRLEAAGMRGFLQKPYALDAVVEMVARALEPA